MILQGGFNKGSSGTAAAAAALKAASEAAVAQSPAPAASSNGSSRERGGTQLGGQHHVVVNEAEVFGQDPADVAAAAAVAQKLCSGWLAGCGIHPEAGSKLVATRGRSQGLESGGKAEGSETGKQQQTSGPEEGEGTLRVEEACSQGVLLFGLRKVSCLQGGISGAVWCCAVGQP